MKEAHSERLLIVAAHPDDEVLGCGGTIARFVDAGAAVRIIFLAEGITARYLPEQFDDPVVVDKTARRNRNALAAAAVLGVPAGQVFVERRYCCRLDQVPLIDLVRHIEHHVREFLPTRLFTHAEHDPNVDHGLVHRAVLAATRPLGAIPLRAVYAFEVLSSTEWNPQYPFRGQAFFDVTTTIDRKVRALAAYDDEMHLPPHPRSEEVVRALARFRGAAAGCHFAEAFQLIRGLDL
ncbi:MAG: PIG-L deacetylase family protein [Thermodesulfobacteriota bacterium]